MTRKWDVDSLGRLAYKEYSKDMASGGPLWETLTPHVKDDFRRIGLTLARHAEAVLMSEETGLHFSDGPAGWLAGRTRVLMELEKRGVRLEAWFQLAVIATGALCQVAYNIAKERGNE